MRISSFALSVFSLVLLGASSVAYAQQLPSAPNLPNVAAPLTGSANNSATGGIPAAPNANGSTAAPLGGSASNPAASTSSQSGDAASRPATQTGAFLQLSLPNTHGLPGSSGPQNLLNTVISNALNFLALIAIGALIYAGVQLVTAQGKADAIGSAKGNIINIIIGFAIVMLAWSGVNIVLQFIGFGR